jgi:flavin reductase (DIM6/NTAB) family NADH-FMN oxidoreductase RutF
MQSGGRYTGKKLDKIGLFKELGVIFYKAKSIKTLMIRGAAINAECKLVKQEDLGDHVMFIGEVTEISADENVKPLVYHNGKYWRLVRPQSVGRFVNSSMYIKAVIEVFPLGIVNGPGLG